MVDRYLHSGSLDCPIKFCHPLSEPISNTFIWMAWFVGGCISWRRIQFQMTIKKPLAAYTNIYRGFLEWGITKSTWLFQCYSLTTGWFWDTTMTLKISFFLLSEKNHCCYPRSNWNCPRQLRVPIDSTKWSYGYHLVMTNSSPWLSHGP